MKKRIFFLVTIMAILTMSVYGQNGKKSFNAGNEFMKNMKYEDAVVQFTGAIAVEPSNGNYYYARGKAYEALNNYKDAKADYEKTLVFTPKNVDALIRLGAVCNNTGDFAEALKHLNRATGIDKRNSTVYPIKVNTLIGLEKYDQALKASDTAIIVKDTPMNYYYRGLIYSRLNNDILAKREQEKAISKNKKLAEPRLALAEILLKNNDPEGALDQCNEVLKNDDRNTTAYLMRSLVHRKNIDYPSAIDDLSKNILIEPDNPQFYLDRGLCYQEFNQHTNAINDFKKYISLNPNNPVAFFARAKSYEEIMDYDKAMEDYSRITVLSEFDPKAHKMLKSAQDRLYELNRETVAPEINLISHTPVNESIEIKGDNNTILISGKIKEKSNIKSLTINNQQVTTTGKNGEYDFLTNVNVSGLDKITLIARDDYDNEKSLTYSLIRTEINPPKITVLAPYASDDGQIYLENNSQNLVLQGKITDESKIKSIFVEGINAAFPSSELNPTFSTTPIDILNKNKIIVEAEDIYGNRQASEFRLNRDAAAIAETNPMGKTWVVFVENSNYSTFASLDGPVKDINLMVRAFANYQIQNIIHKQNMTKAEMEKFFSIELRDLIKTNQVKSLLIWYAGHGKFINEVGYWIPVDAKRDDEFTYFNINTLRASMETYLSYLTHTLVVTDACESGPSFYQAMRSEMKKRSCDDWQATQFKSSQVFSSAGYELAVDDSQFTRTFATALTNNPNACIPIEEVVAKVVTAVGGNNQQRPKFGKITGLKDEDGTFFFIAR
ncbi:MAG: tetratricopeptide repeat protein [Bacteroidales bacterium]|jgi:tetratricopeptide (TPR) repeat protein|nr:tetratricopeptide repeat protein [Bacteroidales bacterium]